jgi:hypothetical protein
MNRGGGRQPDAYRLAVLYVKSQLVTLLAILRPDAYTQTTAVKVKGET